MKNYRCLLAIITIGMWVQAIALERKVESRSVGTVTLNCDSPGDWVFDMLVDNDNDKEIVTIKMSSPSPQIPPRFSVLMSVPQIDMNHLWNGRNADRCQLRPDWSANFRSHLAVDMPVYAFLNDNNENRLTVVSSEPLRDVSATMGLREENCMIVANLSYFNTPEAPIERYETKIMLDRRPVFWSDAVRDGVEWMVREAGIKSVDPPAEAFEPLYSSWYQFHQNVSDKAIEEECRKAADLGMKTIIVDDGWQTDDNNRGYAFCGDWQVSKNRFPDFPGHVKKVQEMGLKYMLWYSVPFVGKNSRNYERFKGKYLWEDYEKGGLDPRFPEVREWICQTYEDAMRNYGLDGFKLDFIDSFTTSDDPARADNYAGRDIKTVPEAVNVLMKEVYDRLSAIKPDVLIEFRQNYVGPAIRQYGNMLRAGDCPGDMQGNRQRIANLRLTSGQTAVHSDMLEWNPSDTPESAARHIFSAMFGVVQYSLMLNELPEDHLRMLRHWMDFNNRHRVTLLEADFRPYHPEGGYPIIEASSEKERINAVYQSGHEAEAGRAKVPTYIINATGEGWVYVDFYEDPKAVEIFNVFGEKVSTQKAVKGIKRLEVPASGYVLIK